MALNSTLSSSQANSLDFPAQEDVLLEYKSKSSCLPRMYMHFQGNGVPSETSVVVLTLPPLFFFFLFLLVVGVAIIVILLLLAAAAASSRYTTSGNTSTTTTPAAAFCVFD
jgi:hypothetical protein